MTKETQTFREAYAVLQGHAETLREQSEPNIDDLLAIVTQSVDAYKVCKERIDAVEKALQQALTDVAAEPQARSAPEEGGSTRPASTGRAQPAASQRASSGSDSPEDDIPF